MDGQRRPYGPPWRYARDQCPLSIRDMRLALGLDIEQGIESHPDFPALETAVEAERVAVHGKVEGERLTGDMSVWQVLGYSPTSSGKRAARILQYQARIRADLDIPMTPVLALHRSEMIDYHKLCVRKALKRGIVVDPAVLTSFGLDDQGREVGS